LQKQAEQVLATIRSMQESIASESDESRRKHTARLLRVALKQFAKYRRRLELLSLHPDLAPELQEQIQLFMMLEDECRAETQGRRPV